MEIDFKDVRVPAAEHAAWARAAASRSRRGAWGPGRIHHAMRLIGVAERALEKMCRRVKVRTTFGRPIAEQSVTLERIAESRIRIDQARLLVYHAAWLMDTVGNKAARAQIAMIKIAAADTACQVVDWAIQAHGAAGLVRRLPPRQRLRARARHPPRRRPRRGAPQPDRPAGTGEVPLDECAGVRRHDAGGRRSSASTWRALERYLAERIPGLQRPLTVQQFRGGQSNPTFLLSAARRRAVRAAQAARRPAPALGARGRPRVPRHQRAARERASRSRARCACATTRGVIGTLFYVMELRRRAQLLGPDAAGA